MKLLDIDTVFEDEKITTRVKAQSVNIKDIDKNIDVYGYEIHMGNVNMDIMQNHFFKYMIEMVRILPRR